MQSSLTWSVTHDPCREGDRMPAGAVTVGAAVRVRLRVAEDARQLVRAAEVLVREHGEGEAGPVGWRAVSLAWDGEGLAAELPLDARPHVAFYVFALRGQDDSAYYLVPRPDGRSTAGVLVRDGEDGTWSDEGWAFAADWLAARPTGDFGLAAPLPGFQVTVYEPNFQTPAWMNGAVMYQIFPDRFARGADGVREEGLAYHERMGRPVRLHRRWDEPVEWKADAPVADALRTGSGGGAGGGFGRDALGPNGGEASGKADVPSDTSGSHAGCPEASADESAVLAAQMKAYDPVDFFGGTLAGIREKLPYLQSLGVGALYLNPVFEARSNHRYDTADYERIDPLLGSDDDFRQLAQAADAAGISIVLDAVLSHTGDDSRYFNAAGAYDQPGAAQGPGSPYYSWYDFEHPSEGAAYRCWWGYPSLPEVNERDARWQEYMLADAHGVLPKWLRAGARGYRLDVADEIPDDVLERIRASVKREDPEAAIVGEVWEDATTKASYGAVRTYALGGALDSVMNYPLRDALIGFALGHIDAFQLATFLKLQQANYPAPLYRSLMNLLSTHDVERVRTVLALGGSVKHLPRDGQLKAVAAISPEDDARAALLQQVIVGILYALPGMPTVYYGDERGMQGGGDPFCRATFPWDDASAQGQGCGADLTRFYRALGQTRKASPALREGEFACGALGPDALCMLRVDAPSGAVAVAVANRSDAPIQAAFDALSPEVSLSPEARRLVGPLLSIAPCASLAAGENPAPLACEDGIARISSAPRSFRLWATSHA